MIFERSLIFHPYKEINANYTIHTYIMRLVFLFFGIFREPDMRVIIQNRKSLLFLKSGDEWTSHINDALDFQGVIKAFDYAIKSKLPAIDVVMHFGDPAYDVRLRVTG